MKEHIGMVKRMSGNSKLSSCVKVVIMDHSNVLELMKELQSINLSHYIC